MMSRLMICPIMFMLFSSHGWAKKIIWWNTAGAWHIEQPLYDDGVNAKKMNQTLKAFSQSEADIIVLGEYHQPIIEADTIKSLKKNFPFFNYIPVSTLNSHIGYAIFSKTFFKVNVQNDALEWGNSITKAEWKKRSENTNWDFTRSLVICQFDDFQLIPVHLAQPWTYLNQVSGLKEILWGNDHPVAYQLDTLNKYPINLPTVMIGDFNLPRKLLGKTPKAWGKLSHWETVGFASQAVSFPASSTHFAMPQMLLDQAFTRNLSQKIKGEVINGEGSDHLPIFISF